MRVFAHRGFSGKYPENTMLAFQKAYEVGCDGIELDVQFSRDGEVMILHDETLDRTTNGHGDLRAYTCKELRSLDASGKFPGVYGVCRIPTLTEYLEWVRDTDLLTNIELKNSVYAYPGLEEKVLELIDRYDLEDRILFSSFSPESVLRCKELVPHIPAGFLTEEPMPQIGAYAASHGVEYYHPGKEILTEKEVQACHAHGVGVNVWTVNRSSDMNRMKAWGVDGIFTNYPNRAKGKD